MDMAKETVRYPDAMVARIEEFVTDSSAFESKSEYHRFASEFLLSLLDPDHQPSVLGYGEIFDDLGRELDDAFEASAGEEPFLETYIRVRRQLLRGDVEEARALVDDQYDVTDREALLLDELIGRAHAEERRPSPVEHRDQATGASDAAGAANGRARDHETEASSESEAENGMDAPAADETAVESEH